MAERRINLKQWEVLAALRARDAGGAWQVWRPLKQQPQKVFVPGIGPMLSIQQPRSENRWLWPNARDEVLAACPLGQPGETLVCREAFRKVFGQSGQWIETDYRATYEYGDRLGDHLGVRTRWSPANQMPRDLVRLTPTVRAVRVARLQDVTEADAVLCGANPLIVPPDGGSFPHVEGFRAAWESTTPGIWDANPWMWVADVAFGEAETKR